jgi:hypothetical protein
MSVMAIVELHGPSKEVFLLEAGILDQRAELAFVYGQCHGLAMALHARCGWPLIGLYSGQRCDHVCVERPNGDFVDVTGAHAAAKVTSESGLMTRTMTIGDIARLESHHGWVRPDPHAADLWVPEVLARAEHGPNRPPLTRPTLDVEIPVDSQMVLRFEWSGANELNVYVRNPADRKEDWRHYGPVGLRPDADGISWIEFTPSRLEKIAKHWLGNNFDPAVAARALADPPSHASV